MIGVTWHDIVSQAARDRVTTLVLKELERRGTAQATLKDIPEACLPVAEEAMEGMEAAMSLEE